MHGSALLHHAASASCVFDAGAILTTKFAGLVPTNFLNARANDDADEKPTLTAIICSDCVDNASMCLARSTRTLFKYR